MEFSRKRRSDKRLTKPMSQEAGQLLKTPARQARRLPSAHDRQSPRAKRTFLVPLAGPQDGSTTSTFARIKLSPKLCSHPILVHLAQTDWLRMTTG